MRSFTHLSLLLYGSVATTSTAAASLNLQPQAIPRLPPDRIAQHHVHTPAKVFYHDAALARRSIGSTRARVARSVPVIAEPEGNTTMKRRGGSARLTTSASRPPGACGTTFADSDFVVALNEAEFNTADHCYRKIIISYGGKTAAAQIVDMCTDCPRNGLDLTDGLFSYFAPASLGVLHGEWSYDPGQPKSPLAEDTAKTMGTKEKSAITSTSQLYSTTAVTTSAAEDPQVVNQLNMAILDMVEPITSAKAIEE